MEALTIIRTVVAMEQENLQREISDGTVLSSGEKLELALGILTHILEVIVGRRQRMLIAR